VSESPSTVNGFGSGSGSYRHSCPLEDYTVSGRKEDRGSKDVASHLNDIISSYCFKLAFSYFKAWYVTKWICYSANILDSKIIILNHRDEWINILKLYILTSLFTSKRGNICSRLSLTYSTQACSYQSINSTPCRLSVTYIRMLK
jgi:hypothetical protein